VIGVPLTRDLQFDMEEIGRRAAKERADVVILCSPNNPSGSVVSEREVGRLARGFSGLVVVDEAYHEFSGQTVAPILPETPNLVVLRTFSKAMAMAGLRVGYLLASPELAREIHKATLPYNLNFFSATAAEVACEKFDLLWPQIEAIISERERVTSELSKVAGVEPVPSKANFLLVRTPIEPQRLFKEFLARDILVRDVSKYPMLGSYIRVSIGAPEENDRMLAALKEIQPLFDTGETDGQTR
jgi:histidinol-phosphate aminotransferase